jgi:hypothetical protein
MEELRFLWHTNKKSLCHGIKKGAAEVCGGGGKLKIMTGAKAGLAPKQCNRLA